MTQTHDVHPTEPETKLFSWKPAPSTLEQALEAANDDPTRRELVNMLCSLGGLHIHVDGTDDEWRPTTIEIECLDKTWQCDRAIGDLLSLMRRAGWRLESVCFGARKRLSFQEWTAVTSDETTGYDPIGVLCLGSGATLLVLSTLSYRLAYGGGLEGTPVGNIMTYMGPLLEPMFLLAFLLGAVTALMGIAVLLRQGVSIAVGV